ncbi:MAG TPA: hypothetical protein VFN42_02815 [Acetobacteraceae bacterium]|nr:hypothetical protein [Acetobacteraceae bacterium]
MRVLFGMDRLPRSLRPDDPRLPSVTLTAAPLRLNSEPLPPETVAAGQGGHAARIAASEAWLTAACGSYAPLRQRFIAFWLRFAGAHVAAHRAELQEKLRPFDGLYAPEDFVWSALRPLPRALLPSGDGVVPVDAAFWDGTRLTAVLLGDAPDVAIDGVGVCRLRAADLDSDGPALVAQRLPAGFLRFWLGETLPMTPFRRALPESQAV